MNRTINGRVGDSTLQDLFFRCSQALEDDASLHAEINIHNRDADVPNIDTLGSPFSPQCCYMTTASSFCSQ